MRVSTPKCEDRIFIPKHKTRVHANTEREVQTRVSLKQHETGILQKRITTPKRKIRILAPKCESRIQSAPGCDSRVPTTQCKVCVLKQTLPKCEAQTRIITETQGSIQSSMSLKHAELKALTPRI